MDQLFDDYFNTSYRLLDVNVLVDDNSIFRLKSFFIICFVQKKTANTPFNYLKIKLL